MTNVARLLNDSSGKAHGARQNPRKVIAFFLRAVLGLLFVMAGVAKYISPSDFLHTLEGVNPYIPSVNPLLIWIIPGCEALLGAMLLFGLKPRAAALILMALTTTFVLVALPQVAIGAQMNCGCFGPLMSEKMDGAFIFRDLVLIGLALLVFCWHPRDSSIKQ